LRRRLHERSDSPQSIPNQWASYNSGDITGFTSKVFSSNEEYLSQTVAWESEGENDFGLLPGNLTDRKLGKTARFVMTSNWEEGGSVLQDLLETQRNSDVYSEVTSEAVVVDTPCGQRATNADIFLFVLAMATAAFGGVEGVLFRLLSSSNWWKSVVAAMLGTPPHKATHVPGAKQSKLSRAWCVLGIVVFFSLYLPLLFQTITEYEVSNFRTEAVDFVVDYSEEQFFILIDLGTRSAFVTMAAAETRCESARPELLMIILIVGFVIGVITNAELFYGAFRCGCCCVLDPAVVDADEAMVLEGPGTTIQPMEGALLDDTYRRSDDQV